VQQRGTGGEQGAPEADGNADRRVDPMGRRLRVDSGAYAGQDG
jgi:hypothetical protein